MRALLALCCVLFAPLLLADPYVALYRAAGWEQQQQHFQLALQNAQQSYRNSLPEAVYQSLKDNSQRRLGSAHIEQRLLKSLRQQGLETAPALAFFSGPVGQRVVIQEVHASSPSELKRNAQGIAPVSASPERRAMAQRLSAVLPVREAGAEVALALGSIAADSLSQMLPGLFDTQQTQNLVQNQRDRLQQQMAGDLVQTLLHVYRELDDHELAAFAEFAESAQGRAYYAAALKALRAGLAVGQPLP